MLGWKKDDLSKLHQSRRPQTKDLEHKEWSEPPGAPKEDQDATQMLTGMIMQPNTAESVYKT